MQGRMQGGVASFVHTVYFVEEKKSNFERYERASCVEGAVVGGGGVIQKKRKT